MVKVKDADACLTTEEIILFQTLLEKVEAYREDCGKQPLDCVVVESDWPMYESTWGSVEEWADHMARRVK